MTTHYDVAVIGLGVIGSAAAYHSALKGAKTIGFEQYEFGHVRGASHDTSRIVRTSYGSPEYVALARAAYRDWAELETRSGIKMLTITGGVVFFPKEDHSNTGQEQGQDAEFNKTMAVEPFIKSLDANKIPYEVLDAAQVNKRWPGFSIPAGVKTIYTADTGIVHAARAVTAFQNQARVNGAVLQEHTRIDSINPVPGAAKGTVVINTAKGRFTASKVILAADAWVNKLLAPLGAEIPLEVMQEQVSYFKPADIQPFEQENLPVWIWAGATEKHYYGFPSYGEPTIKAARDVAHNLTTPETRTFVPSEKLVAELDGFVGNIMPGKGQILRTVTCQYAITPDREFVISPLRKHRDVIVGLTAGHGFKFAPAVGRILAELAIDGKTEENISKFGIPKATSHLSKL